MIKLIPEIEAEARAAVEVALDRILYKKFRQERLSKVEKAQLPRLVRAKRIMDRLDGVK